jgi:hypothetical protein
MSTAAVEDPGARERTNVSSMNLTETLSLAEDVLSVHADSESTLRLRLSAVDWSFIRRERPAAIESIHPYPAKFIGEIPRALLSLLPIPAGTLVLDPFAGSGTTLVEAQRRSLPSIGVDLNPIACLIARVKTAPAPSHLISVAQRATTAARANLSPRKSAIPNVDHWFKPSVQTAIGALVEEIEALRHDRCHDALQLALSSILVRVSNQESDTRYAAVEKHVSQEDVFTHFLTACQKLNDALLARDWTLTPSQVIQANTLKLDASDFSDRVGLVITSPPYPNAYEYWLYHKYRMWWLGFDPLAVKKEEIGARAHFFKRRHHTEDNFWTQMRCTFGLLASVLVPTGYACFVIGRSKIHGQLVDNAAIIDAIAGEHGFDKISGFDRVISASRKSFNLSHANIKTETILVFQKT